MNFIDILRGLWESSGIAQLFTVSLETGESVFLWQNLVMIGVAFLLLYFAIFKGCEPLLLVPIAFGMLLVNLPGSPIFHDSVGLFDPANAVAGEHWYDMGIIRIFYMGVKSSVFPCLIFLGIGAMTDFGPLLANPSSLLLGAAAQLGISMAFFIAILLGFTPQEAASIGIIGGADGPTAIYLTSRLAQHILPGVTIAAYSYMALIPFIQPPLMKLLTTKKEREVKMAQTRKVSKTERIIFPVVVLVLTAFVLPDTIPLIGMLMFGNLLRECAVTDRLSDTAQNALMNIVTIMLGVSVGATAIGTAFLAKKTLLIIFLGLLAFSFSTVGGVLLGKLMYVITKGRINPLIGSAGVSAVPMAARVSQREGAKYLPGNFLLMHAMGPNVAGVIGSAVMAGFLLMVFGE
ncbi:MAG: sodium ion-translocating decarboxylase subunit beta [Oscillospiraceae bacterium]|jgi:oxaloacetate decarboxylase beta subunit|nr:sodium ion-translocating decarboxylase subunit beta [Oscillospiraceae bacterium]